MAAPIIPDGTISFKGGQNSAIEPEDIGPDQYYLGVNVSCQTGALGPRWGIEDIPLDFSATGDFRRATGSTIPFQQVFEDGRFQAFIPYSIGPDYYNIYVVSGYIFIINLFDRTVQVLNPLDPVNVDADRINWSNAAEYLVIFDFPNRPFIMEGIQIRRSDPAASEVPVSVLGAYNQNRLMIANAGLAWTAGDPVGSTAAPDAPITFLEILTPSSPYVADVYEVPTAVKNNTFITAMGFLHVLDKSTEIGSLLVSTADAIYQYPTYLPRSQWQGGTGDAVFGSILLSQGIAGQRAQTNVNSDFFFKSTDQQVYTFTMARNQQYRWANSAISREVNKFLEKGDKELERVAVAAFFMNNIFFSCYPYRVDCVSAEGDPQLDYVNRGLVVIEAASAASIGGEQTPVWPGVWTGVEFTDIAENGGVLYITGKYLGKNRLFVMDPTKTYDVLEGVKTDIRCVVETREYINEDLTTNKEIQSLDLGMREMREKVTVDVSYRSDVNATYFPWRNFDYYVPVEQCSGFPEFPNGLNPQGIRDLNLGGVSQQECDPSNKVPPQTYKALQLRLVIKGRDWKLKYIKLKAVAKPQPETVNCVKESGPVKAQCFNLWEIPNGDRVCN